MVRNNEGMGKIENIGNPAVDLFSEMVDIVPFVLIALALISIIINIKSKNNKENGKVMVALLISFACYIASAFMPDTTPGGVFADGSSSGHSLGLLGYIAVLISIIIQLIPFIICLKNNKKVKKDEVKQ